MQLEQRQVLASRWNVLGRWREKEWWYTGVHDPKSGCYFSWFFIRVNLVDAFAFSVFDPSLGRTLHFSRKLYLRDCDGNGDLCLEHDSKDLKIRYCGSAERGWSFRLEGAGFDVDLRGRATSAPFTKFDDELNDHYGLLHFFHNRVSGSVSTAERSYTLDGALGYYDHCFGKVPRRTGWHWLAVQNEEVALASLVNYGPHAQRYTQAWFEQNEEDYRTREWIRLDQNVSFESPMRALDQPWRVTSPELDLEVVPQLHHTDVQQIPFAVNVTHSEVFVKAHGRIRVDGRWFAVENLAGVMEQHAGTW